MQANPRSPLFTRNLGREGGNTEAETTNAARKVARDYATAQHGLGRPPGRPHPCVPGDSRVPLLRATERPPKIDDSNALAEVEKGILGLKLLRCHLARLEAARVLVARPLLFSGSFCEDAHRSGRSSGPLQRRRGVRGWPARVSASERNDLETEPHRREHLEDRRDRWIGFSVGEHLAD